jgi:phytoene/squalene synthetase
VPVATASLPTLQEAYEACRRETAEWAKTFYLGTLLMPPAKRRAIWAIYVWCRRTDELMDSPEALARPVEELAARLDAWETRTRALFAGDVRDALDLVMRDTIERYAQPLQPYLDMIEGMRMDLTTTRYSDFDHLYLYCYRVAGTVGLMTQEAWTPPTPQLPGAILLTPAKRPWLSESPISSPTSSAMWGRTGLADASTSPRRICAALATAKPSSWRAC